MADVNPILRAANAYSSQLGPATVAIQQNSARQEELANSDADLYRTVGNSAVIVQSVKDQAEIEAQNARAKLGEIYGTNMNSQTEELTRLAKISKYASDKRLEALAAIEEKQSVGFFDNPLEYLSNMFTINSDIEAHNNAVDIENAANEQAAKLNELTQAGAQTQNAFKVTVTAASAEAAAKSTLATAELNANQSIQKAIGYNTEGIKQVLSMSKEQLAVSSDVYRALATQESQQMELARLNLAQEEYKFKKKQHQTEEDFDSELIDRINKGEMILNPTRPQIIEPNSKQAKFIATLLKSNSPAAKEYQAKFFAGSSGIVAPTVGKVIETINTTNVSFSEAQKPVRDLLSDITHVVAKDPSVDLKNPAAVNQKMTEVSRAMLDKMAGNINYSDDSNVFQIPRIEQVIANSPVVQSLPVVQKVLAPVIASGAALNPSQVLALTAKAMAERKITAEEARDISTIFQTATHLNLAQKQLTKFALSPSKESAVTGYKTPVVTDPNALMGGKEVVDMTNPIAVMSALGKYAVRNSLRDAGSELTGWVAPARKETK